MSKYIRVHGQSMPMNEFYARLAMTQVQLFAYDPQLNLFPDPKVEEARAQLRKILDSGKPLEIIVIQK